MKTQERILKEMKGYEKRYRKLHFYEQLLKIFLITLLIIFFFLVLLKINNNSNEYVEAVFFTKRLGIYLIILNFIVYMMQNKILKKYLILVSDTDINIVNRLKFYKKSKGVEKITSVTVTKTSNKDYIVIIEAMISGLYNTMCIDVKQAHSYLDIK